MYPRVEGGGKEGSVPPPCAHGEQGEGAGEEGALTGRGTQQEGEGACKLCLHAPSSPSVHPRLHANVHAKGGGSRQQGEEAGGGRKRVLCPSFPHVSTDTCRCIVYMLFYFVFIYLLC